MGKKMIPEIPDVAQLEAELKRETYKTRYWKAFRSTVYILITVAAVAILVATLWLPVLQIYGSSMTPTLEEGKRVNIIRTCIRIYNRGITVVHILVSRRATFRATFGILSLCSGIFR